MSWTDKAVTNSEGGYEHEVEVGINSEIRLPKPDTKPKDWKGGEELHPFWLVKRSEEELLANMTLGYCEQTVILSSNVKDLQESGCTAITPGVNEFKAKIPVMYNHKDIGAGVEVVLFSEIRPKPESKKKDDGWQTQLLQQARKKQKT